MVDSDNRISAQKVREFGQGMLSELDYRYSLIINKANLDTGIPESLQQVLLDDIVTLHKAIKKLSYIDRSGTDNYHQYLRDQFATIGALSTKLAGKFPSAYLRDTDYDATAPGAIARHSAHFFADFGEYANELKRHHFTRSARKQTLDYTDPQSGNTPASSEGLKHMRKGSEVEKTHEFGFSAVLGFACYVVTLGPIFSGRHAHKKSTLVDADGTIDNRITRSTSMKVGATAKYKSLFPHGHKAAHSIGASATVQITRTAGDYYGFDTAQDCAVADTLRQGNGTVRKFFFRSGDTNSRGWRYRQNAKTLVGTVGGKVLGIKYVSKQLMPVLNQEKLEKGANNETKMAELADRLSTRLPGGGAPGRIGALTRLAYPSIDGLIGMDSSNMGPEVLPTVPLVLEPERYSPLVNLVPTPAPATRTKPGAGSSIHRMTYTGQVSANVTAIDFVHPNKTNTRASVRGGLSYEASNGTIEFQRVKAMHEQLDPGYTNDIKRSVGLLAEVRRAGGLGVRGLDALCETLAVDTTGDPAPEDLIDAKFNKQYTAIRSIRKQYCMLTSLSNRMRSASDAGAGHGAIRGDDALEMQLKSFIKSVFKIDSENCSAEEKKTVDALLKSPELLMTKSYDALSISLGRIGMDIFQNKKYMLFHKTRLTQDAGLKQKIDIHRKNIDVCYASLRNIMDGVFLPIDKETLFRGASALAQCDSISSSRTISGEGKAGFQMAPSAAIPGMSVDPASIGSATGSTTVDAPSDDKKPTIWGISSLGSVGLSFSSMCQTSKVHPNKVRQGKFNYLRFSLQGEGALADVLESATGMALKTASKSDSLMPKKMRSLLNLPPNDNRSELPPESRNGTRAVTEEGYTNRESDDDISANGRVLENARNLLLRPEISVYANEAECFVALKTPFDHGEFTYAKSLQAVRIISRNTQKIGATVGGHLHASGIPVSISGSYARTVSEGVVQLEILGTCPAYQILSFGEIQTVLNQSIKEQPGALRKVMDINNLATLCDFDKMKDLLPRHPVVKAQVDEPDDVNRTIDSEFFVNKFFGIDDSIAGFLGDFENYLKTRRRFDQRTPAVLQGPFGENKVRTEFDRMDDDPLSWETIHAMQAARHGAPGLGAKSVEEGGQSNDEFWGASKDDPRPTLSAEEKIALARVKAYLATHSLTPHDRKDYFMASAEGKIVFQAYCRVLNSYNNINEAVKSRVSYKPEVVMNTG